MKSLRTQVAKAFGQTLKEARMEVGLSQEKLALECGVDRTFISMMERGVRQPALATIFMLCDHLNCSPAELVAASERLMKPKAKR